MSHTPLYQAHTPPTARAWTHRRLFFLVIALAVLSLGAVGLGRGFATPVMVTDAAVEAGSSGTDGSRPDLRTTLRETFVGEPDVPQATATATPAVTPSNGATAEVRAITGTAESAATTPATSPTIILPSRVADNDTGQPSPVPAAPRTPVGTQGPSEVPRSAPAATTSSTPVVVPGTTPASAAPAPAPAKPAATPAPAKPAAPGKKPVAPGKPTAPGKSVQPTPATTPYSGLRSD